MSLPRRTASLFPERLLAAAQYALPQHLLSRVARRVTRCRVAWIKNLLIRRFIRRFRIDLSEARETDYRSYPDFNSFFTRPLRTGARPLANARSALLCPVDGQLSRIGSIRDDTIVQAKGHRFPVAALLGDAALADSFRGGGFAIFYLSPRDYHRVHAPAAARVSRMIYVPGRLFSVNPASARSVPGLYARNERVVCLLETACGTVAVVLVGAMLVGGIETVWAGEITPARPRRPGRHDYRMQPPRLEAGAELGRFNMGSAVIVLAGSAARWNPALAPPQAVRVGELLGYCQEDGSAPSAVRQTTR